MFKKFKDKVIIKKILYFVFALSIFSAIYASVNHLINQEPNEIVPSEVKAKASEADPDVAFAAQYTSNKIKEDPVSDTHTKNLLESQKTQTFEAKQSEKENTTNKQSQAANEIPHTAVTAPSEFGPSEVSMNARELRSVLSVSDPERASTKNINIPTVSNISSNVATLHQADLSAQNHADFPVEKTIKKSKGSLLLAANGPLVNLGGRDMSIGGAEYQIKAGTRLLALLPDGLTIVSGSSQHTSLSIIGPLNDFKFPSGYVITATASLNPSEDKIYIETNLCASKQNKIRSMPCKGTIKDIRGYTGLSGDIYNQSFWSAVVAFAGSTLAAIPLSQITKSSTINGTIENVSLSNTILTSLAAGIQSVTTSIQKGFDKTGTQITIPQDSIVQILFTQDTIL